MKKTMKKHLLFYWKATAFQLTFSAGQSSRPSSVFGNLTKIHCSDSPSGHIHRVYIIAIDQGVELCRRCGLHVILMFPRKQWDLLAFMKLL